MTRSQLVYRVVTPTVEPERATVIPLHGSGGGMDDLLPLARALGMDLRLVVPEAPRGYYDGRMAVFQYWFVGHQAPHPEPASFGDALWQLEQFVYDVLDRPGGDGRLPFLLGYEQGAVLALTATELIPDFLSGVMAVCGYLPTIPGWSPPVRELNGFPVLLVSDPHDRELPGTLATGTAERLRRRGAAVATVAVEGAHLLGDEVASVLREWLADYSPTRV